MENNKLLAWIDCRSADKMNKKVSLINNLSISNILIKYSEKDKIKLAKKNRLIIEINQTTEFKELSKENVILSSQKEILDSAKKQGFNTAFSTIIADEKSMNEAWKEGAKHDFLVIELISDTNIPLELLIAKLQNSKTKIIKKVKTVQDGIIASGVMEKGSDGILLSTDELDEIMALEKMIQNQSISSIELVKAKVIGVQHAGMGYRACIDTIDLLGKNEGMIVGSTSSGGLLVSSETHYLPYMELRPFRVNAGAVHSYLWCPDNETSYITELRAGSTVLCVDTEGNARDVVVGRVKTELRPLLKIEVEYNNMSFNTFIQDDWHIRIFGANKEPLNSTDIKIGDELLAYVCKSGRHVGIKIEENIQEQ